MADENPSNWGFDYALLEDITVPGGDLPTLDSNFQWVHPHNDLPNPITHRVDADDYYGNSDGTKESGSNKRLRLGSCGAPDSKAYKEKMRRDRLNDRFQELCSVLEPGKPIKTDKSAILNDAANTVIQLREELQKLKESCDNLQDKVKELKAEKNEIRDEKLKLKSEKERLEHQVKSLNARPSFLPPVPSPFAPPPQVIGNKFVPFMGYPGIPMWQLMPPTAVDTSEDHALRPPVA